MKRSTSSRSVVPSANATLRSFSRGSAPSRMLNCTFPPTVAILEILPRGKRTERGEAGACADAAGPADCARACVGTTSSAWRASKGTGAGEGAKVARAAAGESAGRAAVQVFREAKAAAALAASALLAVLNCFILVWFSGCRGRSGAKWRASTDSSWSVQQ